MLTTDDYVRLLAVKGDPLERVIVCHRDELSQVIDPYAGIWVDHVEHRRLEDDPTRVEDAWMDFAGSHYTALVRVFQAYRKLGTLTEIAGSMAQGDDSALNLIELHDVAAGFWEHIGAGIDNLSACWTDAPPLRVQKAKEKIVAPDGTRLDWMYDRRSQFIHSRVVPKGVLDGVPYFNVRLFDSKSTDWKSEYVREEFVEDTYKSVWTEFLGLIGGEWQTLRARLRDRDVDRKARHEPEVPDFDYSQIHPSDIQIDGGPVPPSSIPWNFPDVGPSGSL